MSRVAVAGLGLLAILVVLFTIVRLTALGGRSRMHWTTYTPTQKIVTVVIVALFVVIFVRALSA